jgi:ribosomal protein S18 acetylase RimI-like enzyme
MAADWFWIAASSAEETGVPEKPDNPGTARVGHDSPPGYDLRSALPCDLDWLVGLRKHTMTDYFTASGEELSREDHERRVLNRFDSVRIVTLGNTDIGMLKVDRGADDWKLVQMQLLPAYQRRGIGTRIIADLLATARRKRVPVTLKVLKVNPAKRLYERLGFRVTAETKHSYEMRSDT